MIDLTISIISYNTKDLLSRCLASIFKFTRKLNFEVIVTDNASSDDSAAMVKREFPQVKLIRNRINRWYTGATNQALKLARGRYFLILNSDIFLNTNAFKTMIAYLDRHPRVGAIESLQIYEHGRIAPTGSRHNTPLTDFFELTWLGRKLANQKLLNRFRMVRKNRRHTWPAQVICDAALMTRTDLVKKIGGYDEKLKLYYTENDLCRRIQNQGLTTVHLGQAAVKHTVSASTAKVDWKTISGIYAADVFHYYRKWHGPLPAALLFLSLKLNHLWPFASIFILAAILRVWRLAELMPFIGDFGHDYLAARDLLTTGKIPLLGIASSVPWLYQGSLWIYLTAAALFLGNFHPVAPAILTVILSLITLWAITEVAWKYWGKLAAIASGLIFATSPLTVLHARTPWHTSPIPLAAIGYFYFLLKRSSFWAAFFFSVLFQFELSNAPLVLLLLFTRINKYSLIGLLIPLMPKVIYDLTHNFSQLGGFILWIGYRIAAFFGYRGAHTVSPQRLVTTTQIIFDYLTKFFSWGHWLPAILLLGFIVLTLRKTKTTVELLTVYWLLITFVSFYIHGTPSEAYFPVLFPILALTVGWGIGHAKFLLVPLIALSVFNSWWLFNHRFGNSGLTLSERLIIADTPEALIRIGPGSEHVTFLDNYYYLIWWKNRQP